MTTPPPFIACLETPAGPSGRAGFIAGLALAWLATFGACSATKAAFKSLRAAEQGTEGWRNGGISATRIDAVRETDHLIIEAGSADTYVVRIDPQSLKHPTPPWAGELVATDRTGLQGVARTYRIPRGRAWEEVRQWYLKWFDFKPIAQ